MAGPPAGETTLLDIVLDSSIYRSHPRRDTAAFRALTRLCVKGQIRLHVPYFVKNEFLTQQRLAVKTACSAVETSIRTITRTCVDQHFVEFVKKAADHLESFSRNAEGLAVEDFERWLLRCNAVNYPIADDHGRRVAEDYFVGSPPFTSPKHRADIPDSFIWQTILDIATKASTLHAVVNDGALSKAVANKTNVIVYKELSDFIDSAECQDELKALAANTVVFNFVRATSFLRNQKTVLIQRAEADLVQILQGKTFLSPRIRNANNEAAIAVVGEWCKLDFEFDGVDFYGEREIGIPFHTEFSCQANYRMERPDFLAMTIKETKGLGVTERDSYFDIIDTFKLNLEATLLVELPPEELKLDDLPDAHLLALLRKATSTVEVKDLAVIDDEE